MKTKIQIWTIALGLSAASAFGHGPQLQITNTGNKIVTRNLFQDEHYNTFPAPATDAVNIYVIPMGATAAFGGTRWFARPNAAMNSGPGVAYGYGWTYDQHGTPADPSDDTYTTTFPVGAKFVEQMNGQLQKWNGGGFVDAGASELYMFRGSGATIDESISGSADTTITYGTITAPSSPDPDPHASASFEILGDGIVPSASHAPAPVADGIYMASLGLSLIDQPTGSYIAPSDSFYFVMYKGVSGDDAFAAASAAFPGAAIQVVPEPVSIGVLMMASSMVLFRRGRR